MRDSVEIPSLVIQNPMPYCAGGLWMICKMEWVFLCFVFTDNCAGGYWII